MSKDNVDVSSDLGSLLGELAKAKAEEQKKKQEKVKRSWLGNINIIFTHNYLVTFGLTVTIPCIGLVIVLSEAVISTS